MAKKNAETKPAETEQQLKNRLRNEAEREVLNNHREEFYALVGRKYADVGLVFKRRLTEEEKAQKQIEELYAKFPHLRPGFGEIE